MTTLKQFAALIRSRNVAQWEVKSTVTFPVFCGEHTEHQVSHGHGVFTTEEVFAPEYQLLGWIDAGYRLVSCYEEEGDTGVLVVTLKHGQALHCFITYTPNVEGD